MPSKQTARACAHTPSGEKKKKKTIHHHTFFEHAILQEYKGAAEAAKLDLQ